MKFIVSSRQMKIAEETANKHGISNSSLMYNAGCAVYKAVCEILGDCSHKNIIILCGAGNNGGDGFVTARKLKEDNANVTAVMTASLPVTVHAADAYELCRDLKVNMLGYTAESERVIALLDGADMVIDCVYGTGFHGRLPDTLADLFKRVNTLKAVKIAVDIPSGLNPDNGIMDENAIIPDYTFILGAIKRGVYNLDAEKLGEIKILDIGISPDMYKESGYSGFVTDKDIAILYSGYNGKRNKHTHKGDYGKLLNIAGSKNYIGAAALSTKAAIRSGVGLCYLATHRKVISAVSSSLYEPVYIDINDLYKSFIYNAGQNELDKYTAIAMGCGIGQSDMAKALVSYVIKNSDCPIILDADGINCLIGNINILKEAAGRVVITPHTAEFSRITGESTDKILSDRINAAVNFAAEFGAVVVLKGHNTVIANPSGMFAVNPTGNPGMATAGTGDVLTGIIAAFAAMGLALFDSAVSGVYYHGLAGDIAAEKYSETSLIASDLIEELKYIY